MPQRVGQFTYVRLLIGDTCQQQWQQFMVKRVAVREIKQPSTHHLYHRFPHCWHLVKEALSQMGGHCVHCLAIAILNHIPC